MNYGVSSLPLKDVLQGRARMYQQIRSFFLHKDVLEVETPIFSQAGNPDPAIQSLKVDFRSSEVDKALLRYAQTSPEFAMKRLLAEGAGSMYQICKVFRLGESGRLHNPEFSMLEWYRPGLSYLQLMDEVEELLRALDIISTECRRMSYAELFKQHLDLNILSVSVAQLKSCAAYHKLDVVGMDNTYNEWCDLLLSHLIEPELKAEGAVFIYDYPASQAALANIRADKYDLAERFELYVDGTEIANGYQELTDAVEYQRRFLSENMQRKKRGFDEVVIDQNLLSALSCGLPESSGVALGLDRLLMCQLQATQIKDVLSFDFNQA